MTHAAPSSHLVISGAGRAGTSFLMALLTRLGLDTGFTAQDVERALSSPARAGLELDLLHGVGLPRVVKNPNLCDHIEQVLVRTDLRIEHLIVPLREPEAAAASRERAQHDGLAVLPWHKRWRARLKRKPIPGGRWPSAQHLPQAPLLVDRVHRLLLAAAAHDVPVTLLAYPRLVCDPVYLYDRLAPLLPGIDRPRFDAAFHAEVRPDRLHAGSRAEVQTAAWVALPLVSGYLNTGL
jgi:hypothetical protein